MNKRIGGIAAVLLLFMLVPLTGCQKQASPQPDPETPKTPNQGEVQTMEVAVYYPKDSNNEMYLVRELHQVPKSSDAPLASLNELINGVPLVPGTFKIIPADTRVLGVKIENGTATVDFSREVLAANTGSSGEALGIKSIVNTLTEFPEIEKVQFTVEGRTENAMDWWGHVGLYDQPFQRDLNVVYEPVIWVTAPLPGQKIRSPVTIQGAARIFEATVSYRLRDAGGAVLAEGHSMASTGAPERGVFTAELSFDAAQAGKGRLEVYEVSMKDGSDLHMVTIPVEW